MSSDAPRQGPWAFGADIDSVQLTWRDLGRGTATVHVDPGRAASGEQPARVELFEVGPGPGSHQIMGLRPDREVQLVVESPAGRRWSRRVRTLAPPPGPELFRFATISDMHLGEERFGFLGRMAEPESVDQPYAVRAAAAALDEIQDWGAQLVVAKGDLTNSGRQADWDQLGAMVADRPFSLMAVAGNHDTWEPARSLVHPRRGRPDPLASPRLEPHEALRRLGWSSDPVQIHDVDGLRIVVVDTTRSDSRAGTIAARTPATAEAAAGADGPVFVVLHHQLMTTQRPTHLPVGIRRDEAEAFLDAMVRANPAAFITSGHTHRHRRRQRGPLVITEVGSTKDYPGTWGGYVVHPGGIRQVVRRIGRPDVLAWTDRSAAAALGAWGRWSPGRLDDRCFSHRWPRPGSVLGPGGPG